MSGLNCPFYPVYVNGGAQAEAQRLQQYYDEDLAIYQEQVAKNDEQQNAIADNVLALDLSLTNFETNANNGLASGYGVIQVPDGAEANMTTANIKLWDMAVNPIVANVIISVNTSIELTAGGDLNSITFVLYDNAIPVAEQGASMLSQGVVQQTLTATFLYTFTAVNPNTYIELVVAGSPNPAFFSNMITQFTAIKNPAYV